MKASDCKTSQVSEDRVYDPREEPRKCLVLCCSLSYPRGTRSTPDIKYSLEASCVPEVERLFWEASGSETALREAVEFIQGLL